MADIVALVLPFFGLIFIGYLVARLALRSSDDQAGDPMRWLNIFIIYVALPALFFKLVARTPIEQLTRFDFVLTAVGATYVVFSLIFLIARVLRKASLAEATLQGLAAAYGNIGFMGPGIALSALGSAAAVPVALIFCFENIVHFTVAPALMSASGKQTPNAGALIAGIARRIILHPFILSTAAGFIAAAFSLEPPLAVQRMIDSLAQAAAPCALFAMGITLALRPLKRVPAEIYYIVPAKLILHPALAYLALSAVGSFDPIWVETAIVLASLPTATNVFVIGQQYGVWQQRASATILITTVLSVLSVTLWLYLIRSGTLAPDLFP